MIKANAPIANANANRCNEKLDRVKKAHGIGAKDHGNTCNRHNPAQRDHPGQPHAPGNPARYEAAAEKAQRDDADPDTQKDRWQSKNFRTDQRCGCDKDIKHPDPAGHDRDVGPKTGRPQQIGIAAHLIRESCRAVCMGFSGICPA